jgi:hypothetical protein
VLELALVVAAEPLADPLEQAATMLGARTKGARRSKREVSFTAPP